MLSMVSSASTWGHGSFSHTGDTLELPHARRLGEVELHPAYGFRLQRLHILDDDQMAVADDSYSIGHILGLRHDVR
jgi:hypothetical protein